MNFSKEVNILMQKERRTCPSRHAEKQIFICIICIEKTCEVVKIYLINTAFTFTLGIKPRALCVLGKCSATDF
jgi:hypothetical protein